MYNMYRVYTHTHTHTQSYIYEYKYINCNWNSDTQKWYREFHTVGKRIIIIAVSEIKLYLYKYLAKPGVFDRECENERKKKLVS